MNETIANIRKDYSLQSLDMADVDSNPFKQFQKWLDEAIEAQITEPTAMHLATATILGKPSGRVVLLKGLDEEGFKFYSNYASHKGQEIDANPQVALTFFWAELERQVRIEGTILKLDEAEATEYFHSRPRLSQIGAIASQQSQIIASREDLEKSFEAITLQYEGQEIPKPSNWGGYKVIADKIEFWQGRRSRLHDRLQYELEGSNWHIVRLAP